MMDGADKEQLMDFRLEVVVIPVSDVDRTKEFYQGLVSFADPDGNSWFVQEITTRLPGRETSALAVYDSVDGLADALRRAEAAHGKYEEETGKPDPDWPQWYARYLADEAAGQGGAQGGA